MTRPGFLPLIFGLSLLLAACASVRQDPSLAPGAALAKPEETALWHALVPPEEAARGHSGFFFLEGGLDAYETRLLAIESAARTIDLQYYIWDFDGSGRAISEALFRAAERGVHVRALVDGYLVDNDSEPLKQIVNHPNIDVRIYNAFRTSFWPRYLRYGELLIDFPRLNQRMHNKIIAVDNTVAIVGGRNVNDTYFALDGDHYFLDLDVVIAGPLTKDVSASFDAFWNSPYAVPVEHFVEDETIPFSFATVWNEIFAYDMEAFPLPRRLEVMELAEKYIALEKRFVWAPASLVLTAPGPVFQDIAVPPGQQIETAMLSHIASAEREVLIQNPYVMMTEPRAAVLADAQARGVRTILQTNSLASHDSALVHYGFVRDRKKFMGNGVALYELKPRPDNSRNMPGIGLTPEKTTLHSKTIVFDRRYVLVGSFNLDPRSIDYNSEIGILIESPKLASRVAGAIEVDLAPENSWRVVGDGEGGIVWLDETETPPLRLDTEPETSFVERIPVWLGYVLPIDHLL
ncbi:phospholipase D/Transphosphatidylase [Parvibaculum lavamentivorans DS-1]|uniref:Phospholipase D n=1 Tax=Parvibaculum lavamentivorans (strain DS-1 / DSM 13023 / NCIMB 13966) TaxID=402881 RepID=A7HV35_PARL1|nr:phospholipase D family protein [Parvibaculum lavamentivorans]ABS63768.1 phospholipase D/Transphosphatidylase [Parvibaculum lavamentivorans DS-1]